MAHTLAQWWRHRCETSTSTATRLALLQVCTTMTTNYHRYCENDDDSSTHMANAAARWRWPLQLARHAQQCWCQQLMSCDHHLSTTSLTSTTTTPCMHAPMAITDNKFHCRLHPHNDDDTYAVTAAARWRRQGVLLCQPPQHGMAVTTMATTATIMTTPHPPSHVDHRLSTVSLSRQSPPHQMWWQDGDELWPRPLHLHFFVSTTTTVRMHAHKTIMMNRLLCIYNVFVLCSTLFFIGTSSLITFSEVTLTTEDRHIILQVVWGTCSMDGKMSCGRWSGSSLVLIPTTKCVYGCLWGPVRQFPGEQNRCVTFLHPFANHCKGMEGALGGIDWDQWTTTVFLA